MSSYGHLPAGPSIPLLCNICPKKPVFSDVSHLLTHVASKGHLSYYYKLKVTASTDAESKMIVDEYDEWYEQWGVEDLMMERMSQKERKKNGSAVNANGTRANTRRASKANSNASSRAASTTRTVANRLPRAERESTLDPALGPPIKIEPKSRSGTPASAGALEAAIMSRSFAPSMQNWPMTPYGPSRGRQETSLTGSLYSTPTSDSMETESIEPSIGDDKQAEAGYLPNSFEVENNDAGEDSNKNATKLKGTYHPGMGLFDSATPDMRRKRNQKKATSVIEYLQATSETIAATELVFDQEGDLRRERPITGNPESDDGMSPLKGESSPEPDTPKKKKKAARKPRQPLTEKNVNTGRVTRRRGESHHPAGLGRSRTLPYFGGGDEDDDLTFGRALPKARRTNLSIHRDNSGPEITFDRPAPFAALTAPFRNPLQAGGARSRDPTYQSSFLGRGHQRQPSFGFPPMMRTANSNPLGLPPPNFGSFGQLSGHSMFQNNNPFALSTGHQAFTPFQQHLSVGSHTYGNESHGFHSQSHGQNPNHAQSHNPWDIFSFGQSELGIQNNADIGFSAASDFPTTNPLFFSSARGGLEDDEATVSAPASER